MGPYYGSMFENTEAAYEAKQAQREDDAVLRAPAPPLTHEEMTAAWARIATAALAKLERAQGQLTTALDTIESLRAELKQLKRAAAVCVECGGEEGWHTRRCATTLQIVRSGTYLSGLHKARGKTQECFKKLAPDPLQRAHEGDNGSPDADLGLAVAVAGATS